MMMMTCLILWMSPGAGVDFVAVAVVAAVQAATPTATSAIDATRARSLCIFSFNLHGFSREPKHEPARKQSRRDVDEPVRRRPRYDDVFTREHTSETGAGHGRSIRKGQLEKQRLAVARRIRRRRGVWRTRRPCRRMPR